MDGDSDSIEHHYDAVADIWAEFTQQPTKKHLLWPTIRSLLPPVDGLRVLDAGCGDGHYAARLADRGADVLGIDASQEMIRTAEERHGDRVDFRRARVDEPLEFLEDDSFDLVCCQHVFSHLPSLETPVEEFARVLRPGGSVVLSTHHPFHDFQVVRDEAYPDAYAALEDLNPVVEPSSPRTNYHETERFKIHWTGEESSNPGVYYRRSLTELLRPLLETGFDLRALEEPAPNEAFEREFPDAATELERRVPRSICLRAQR
ncbi:class I SAM-dependent methyltransferase [Halopiger xanaduensis]|uniref:Methyltransferase type 11 n=1 Tax=Halopiger xanaduensis (strain DSM 18323 / JCM 14033 / SH-6) TaxID=797210 RepID=F8D7Y1_HALXS|nr:class I SAM-dependent methyltransferase [Halopiger xanaduensis]AEH36714.1 Methyltransferase type 11 [Halopiger xanaduensis SH-6]